MPFRGFQVRYCVINDVYHHFDVFSKLQLSQYTIFYTCMLQKNIRTKKNTTNPIGLPELSGERLLQFF